MIEPGRDARPEALNGEFRRRLDEVFARLRARGLDPRMIEGLRTVERQEWIYAEGRTRAGSIRTSKDGFRLRSNHQERWVGSGGFAADIMFSVGGRLEALPASSREFRMLASVGETLGLRSGIRFGMKPSRMDLDPFEISEVSLGWDSGHLELSAG